MLKLVVSALTVSTVSVAALRPEPPFTLRNGNEMARPLPVRGQPLPRQGPGELRMDLKPKPDPRHGDPRPQRPPPPPPPAGVTGVEAKAKPLVPGQHSRPDRIRALHGHSDDDHHDRHDDHHDHDHDEHHGLWGAPHMPMRGPPGPKGRPGMGAPPPPTGKPVPGKPAPSMMGGGMMKPKPNPKPKPQSMPPLHDHPLSSSRSRDDIEEMTDEAQQQCQLDYARLCSPAASYLANAGPFMNSPFRTMNSPQDSFSVDIFMITEDPAIGMGVAKPCGTKVKKSDDDSTDNNDDDDGDDDDSDEDDEAEMVVFKSPLLDVVQSLFDNLRLTRPVPQSLPPTRGLGSLEFTVVTDDDPMSLGFGAEGDMCLLNNFMALSPQCQDSIDDLQMMVDDWDMDDEGGCHVMPFLFFLLLVCLMVRCVARNRMMLRKDSLQTTLAAIHASPELRAKVEAASGIPVPPTLPACRARMAMAQKPWYVKVLCVLGFVVISFAIVLNALNVTGLILLGIYGERTEEEDTGPSPLLVLALFFSVLALEVVLVKRLRAAICAYANAPTPVATASSGTSSAGNGNGQGDGHNGSGAGRSTLPQIFQRMRAVQVSSLLPARFAPAPTTGQYQPLLSEEDYEQQDNTEMITVNVSASAPPPPASASRSAVSYTAVPVVLAPIGYAPSNVHSSISMF